MLLTSDEQIKVNQFINKKRFSFKLKLMKLKHHLIKYKIF